jgi:kynurenine formamidase
MNGFACGIIAAGAIAAGAAAFAQTPSWVPPTDAQRCPSRWGPNDERGAANHMGPASVLKAARLIKTGEVFELGHVLSPNMPGVNNGNRQFSLLTKQTAPPAGANRRAGNEELIVAEMGQVGTQFDGFAHQTHGDSFYNCFKAADITTRNGFKKLGIQNVGALMTRGVLVDVAGYKGVEMLADDYEITVADIEGALKKQNVSIEAGDAVILHTGWARLWNTDKARYSRGNPGIGVKAAEWIIAKDPMLMGADTAPVEVNPNPDKLLSLPIHELALAINGVHLLENLDLEALAQGRVYAFALIVQPLKLEGATGSTVAPIAVR